MTSARVLVIETQGLVPLGNLEYPLRAAGVELEYWRPAEERPPTTLSGFSGLVALGGAANPDEDEIHPWLGSERKLLVEVLDRGIPTVGICLGAELLAQVLQATVTPLPRPEIGWVDLEPDQASQIDPLCGGLPRRFSAFQWHSYGFDQPPGTTLIAGTRDAAQIFGWQRFAWGFQFHLEVDKTIISRWIHRYGDSLRANGLDSRYLRAETALRDQSYGAQARRIGFAFAELVVAFKPRRARVIHAIS